MFWSILSVVFVFPFCCVCGFFTPTRRGRSRHRTRHTPGSSNPPRARVRARGAPSCAAVWTRPFGIFFRFSVFGRGSQGPPGPFLEGRGRVLPPQVPFSHARLFFPRPRSFFLFLCSLFFLFLFLPSGPDTRAG